MPWNMRSLALGLGMHWGWLGRQERVWVFAIFRLVAGQVLADCPSGACAWGEGSVVGSRWEEKEGDGREVSGQCPTEDRVGPFW